MQKVWKVLGIAVLVVILGTAAAAAALVLAQDVAEGDTGPFDFGRRLHEAIAGALGITVEKYDAAVETAQEQVLDEAVTDGWLTQDQAERMRERMEQDPGAPGMGRGFAPGKGGMGPHMDSAMGPRGGSLLDIVAEKLDVTVEELITQLRSEKSIADLAQEKGVDTQVIIDAYLAKLAENLNTAVADGRITQKAADSMLEQAKQRLPDQLSTAGPAGMPGGFRGRGHHGGQGEPSAAPAAPAPTASPEGSGL